MLLLLATVLVSGVIAIATASSRSLSTLFYSICWAVGWTPGVYHSLWKLFGREILHIGTQSLTIQRQLNNWPLVRPVALPVSDLTVRVVERPEVIKGRIPLMKTTLELASSTTVVVLHTDLEAGECKYVLDYLRDDAALLTCK